VGGRAPVEAMRVTLCVTVARVEKIKKSLLNQRCHFVTAGITNSIVTRHNRTANMANIG